MKTYRIRKDDKVMVIAGKDAGKIGKVLKILRKKDKVLVEKANMVKRHMRPQPLCPTARRHRGKRDAHPCLQCHGGVLRLRQSHARGLQDHRVRGQGKESALLQKVQRSHGIR